METPNGNPIASILPGLPTLQHRDSVIVMFRTGVDTNALQSVVTQQFYPVDPDREMNFNVGTSAHFGKLQPLEEIISSLTDLRSHPGVISPEYQALPDAEVPEDGYYPFVSLKIMPFQMSRLKTLSEFTPNIYIVTAGMECLIFERYNSPDVPPKAAQLPKQTPALTGIAEGRLNVGNMFFNERLGAGLPLDQTSLWLSLQHNFKTGMLLSMCAAIPLFNPVHDGQQHGVVFVSGEESEEQVVAAIYKYVRYICEGVEVDAGPIMDRHCHRLRGDYLAQMFGERGWNLYVLRKNPTTFHSAELESFLDDRAAEGVKIELVAVDNLYVLGGSHGGRAKYFLRDLNNIRRKQKFHLAATNYMSLEAKASLRKSGDVQQWLTEMAVEGQYDVPLAREADMVYLQHVDNYRGEASRLLVKPAGFQAGKQSFHLPLTPGGYTHERR